MTTTYQLTVFSGDHFGLAGNEPGEVVLAEVVSTSDEIPWEPLAFEAQKAFLNRPELFVPGFVDGFAFPKLTVYRLGAPGEKHIPVTKVP